MFIEIGRRIERQAADYLSVASNEFLMLVGEEVALAEVYLKTTRLQSIEVAYPAVAAKESCAEAEFFRHIRMCGTYQLPHVLKELGLRFREAIDKLLDSVHKKAGLVPAI